MKYSQVIGVAVVDHKLALQLESRWQSGHIVCQVVRSEVLFEGIEDDVQANNWLRPRKRTAVLGLTFRVGTDIRFLTVWASTGRWDVNPKGQLANTYCLLHSICGGPPLLIALARLNFFTPWAVSMKLGTLAHYALGQKTSLASLTLFETNKNKTEVKETSRRPGSDLEEGESV